MGRSNTRTLQDLRHWAHAFESRAGRQCERYRCANPGQRGQTSGSCRMIPATPCRPRTGRPNPALPCSSAARCCGGDTSSAGKPRAGLLAGQPDDALDLHGLLRRTAVALVHNARGAVHAARTALLQPGSAARLPAGVPLDDRCACLRACAVAFVICQSGLVRVLYATCSLLGSILPGCQRIAPNTGSRSA